MEKCQFLKVANGVRKERSCRAPDNKTGRNLEVERSAALRFSELAKDLSGGERLQLLQSLKSSLEKERRRCIGRKHNYDPGRHISLYIAIKTLTSEKRRPPE
jgi:hypothetical protein